MFRIGNKDFFNSRVSKLKGHLTDLFSHKLIKQSFHNYKKYLHGFIELLYPLKNESSCTGYYIAWPGHGQK